MPLFQYQQSRNRGFTLLELLIVMVIVALMVTMVVLSVNLGRGDSALKDSARRLHAIMQLASEEAILFNKSLGVKFEEDEYSFYELVEREVEEDPDDPDSELIKEKAWEAIDQQGDSKGAFSLTELPDYHEFMIFIEGTEISVKEDTFGTFNDDQRKKVKPTLFITPDGEIFPDFDIQIQHQDSDAFASIKFNKEGELELKLDDGEDF